MSSIDFFYENVESLTIHEKSLISHLNSLIKNELKMQGNIAVIFCSDEYLLEMNKEYLEHDYYTDIITFDYVEGDVISGDLFISFDRIAENAKTFNTTLFRELYRVVFHGVLHLVGYNDKSDEDAKTMREKENYYLSEVDFSEWER